MYKKINLKWFVFFLLYTCDFFAQTTDQRAEYIQNGTFNSFMSADGSYFKANSSSDNNPYGYGYWVTAHTLETLADAYQRTRNSVYKDRMKNIIDGVFSILSAAVILFTKSIDVYTLMVTLLLAVFIAIQLIIYRKDTNDKKIPII